MRTKSIFLAAGVLTMSLAPIGSGLMTASAQVYDFTTIAGLATHLGSVDGTNSDARFDQPYGVAVETNGNVYVADTYNHTIRKITPVGTNLPAAADWVTTTIAGLAGNSGSTDGTNSTARFNYPIGIAADANGNLYVADYSNHTIRKVTPVGTNWVTSTIAGAAGVPAGAADGTNNTARFYYPQGIALDSVGNLYITDLLNYTIRKITPVGTNWVTSTIAGSVTNSGSADGTNNTARFYYPSGVTVDTNGNLYVADQFNNIVRKVTPAGTNWVTSTIAGLAGSPGSADGTNTGAQFYWPTGVAVDTNGNLYVADMVNVSIRKITPVGMNWVVSTIGGLAGNPGGADGLNDHARFYGPSGIAVDSGGNLYVADQGNYNIRLGVPLDILTITKETAKLNFAKTNSDSCTLAGTLTLESGFSVTNTAVTVDIGGAQASFILDAKGRGASPPNTCKLSYKKKTGPWTFTATLKNGSWATPWAAYELTNATISGVSVKLPVVLEIGGETFAGEKALLYKAKAGKSGSAK